jgi:hypothetical protein
MQTRDALQFRLLVFGSGLHDTMETFGLHGREGNSPYAQHELNHMPLTPAVRD